MSDPSVSDPSGRATLESDATIQFSAARALRSLSLLLMIGLVSSAFFEFFNPFAAIGLSIVVTGTTALVVEMAADSRNRHVVRGAAAAAAVALCAVTVSASSAQLYVKWFGPVAAVKHMKAARAEKLVAVDLLIANADAAARAAIAWRDQSLGAAQRERTVGNSCPAVRTGATRGPVALWREREASVATTIASQVSSAVARLRDARERIPSRTAETYDGLVADSLAVNKLIQELNAMVGSQEIFGIEQSVRGRLAVEPVGVRCGDDHRQSLVTNALSALRSMRSTNTVPELTAPIDLRDGGDVVSRSLIRAYNIVLKLVSLGTMGSFADDPLMKASLESGSIINNETASFLLAGVLELAVIITSAVAGRVPGRAPFRFAPKAAVTRLQRAGESMKSIPAAMACGIAAGILRIIANSVSVDTTRKAPSDDDDRLQVDSPMLKPEPRIPHDVVATALRLVPYQVLTTHLIVLPEKATATIHAAAGSLVYQGVLSLVTPGATGSQLAPELAYLAPNLQPSARYIVYRLHPALAEALRRAVLADDTVQTERVQ